MTSATTPEVDAIGALPFTGNLIPHAWYTALTFPSGKPDLVAITLLADIVYWYRPVVERDPATGQVLRQRKKFKADMLQRSYQAFADQFGFTKRQVHGGHVPARKDLWRHSQGAPPPGHALWALCQCAVCGADS